MEGGKGAAIDDEGGSVGGKEDSLGLKLRRGVAVGKKGVLCTPVPTWKLGEPGYTDGDAGEAKRSSVSARKLGANLWDVQDLMPIAAMSRRSNKIRRHGEGKTLDNGDDDQPESSGSLRRRHVAAALVKHHNKLNEGNARTLQPVSPASYSSSMEIAAVSQAITPSSLVNLKGKLGEAGYGLRTSTELLKVLNRIWSLEEQHASSVSLVKALKVELEHAQARIQELMQEQHVYRIEMDDLMKQVAEDRVIRKNKEQQKIKAAVQSIKQELEDERQIRRRSEILHRKLGKELSEVNAAYMKALKDLERERKTNSLLEDLCDEFAKGITDYEQALRQLKQNYPSDCEPKVDRLVLQISEAWLDERLQVDVAEAEGNLEENSSVTDRLRNEIESFLRARRFRAFRNDFLSQKAEKKDGNMRRQSLESVHLNGTTSAPNDVDDDDDSVASDVQCFVLNVGSCKRGSHEKLKQNDQNGMEKSDSRFVLYESNEKKGKTKSSRKSIQHLEAVTGAHFPTDDECAGDEDRIETSLSKKPDYCHSHECGQEAKVKWTRMHQLKPLTENSVKNLSEIAECRPQDHGTSCEDSHSYLMWKRQLASAGGQDDTGHVHHISSPVQQWKYQHGSPDVPEPSSKLAQGIKESTLKAKLLEARLEGKHTRLKSLKQSSMIRTRQCE